MAHLVRRQRYNPASEKTETYFLPQERGHPAEGLGFVDEKTAKDALRVYQGRLVQEARGVARPTTSPVSSAPPPPPPLPTINEWWGDADLRTPVDSPSPMHKWAIAQGKTGDALRVLNDSRKVLVADQLGKLRLDEVNLRASDEFIVRLRGAGLRSRTIQIRIGHLQHSLRVAEEYGVLKAAAKLKAPRNTDKKPYVWHTPDQARLLVEELRRRARPVAGKGGRPALIDSLTLLAICADVVLGLRKGELLTRRWADVDWSMGLLRVADQRMPDGTTWHPKTSRSVRTVSVPSDLLAMLREEWLRQGRGSGWIFPADKGDKPRGDFRRALASACRAAGLPVLHPHALRHTWATAWLWGGATMPDVIAEGGWSSAAVPTAIYVHTAEVRRKEIAEAVSPLRASSRDAAPLTTGTDQDSEAGGEASAEQAKIGRRS